MPGAGRPVTDWLGSGRRGFLSGRFRAEALQANLSRANCKTGIKPWSFPEKAFS
jgi:hypothetical protein